MGAGAPGPRGAARARHRPRAHPGAVVPLSSRGRKKGKKHEGVIEKINSSKATVVSNNRQWSVPFELMEGI